MAAQVIAVDPFDLVVFGATGFNDPCPATDLNRSSGKLIGAFCWK